MLRTEQWETLSNLRLRETESKRIDCLFCGGKKTLTVSRLDGKVVWNCYKASCNAKGGKRVGRSIEGIKAKLANPEHKQQVRKWTQPLPEISSDPKEHDRVLQYLQGNHALQAYMDRAIKVTYDPQKDRVLFWMNGNIGAVGRTLRKDIKPKWLSYGDTAGILSVGDEDTAVIVEDAASACAVYTTGIYTGVALLGTNVSTEQKHALKRYKKLIVCLDKDASAKAVAMARKLNAVVPTTVRLLSEDFKYMEPRQILNEIETIN